MESSTFLSSTPPVGELSAQSAAHKPAKSPPLAFEKTSNDSLAPLPTLNKSTSPTMAKFSSFQEGEEPDPQVIVDQQASAIQLLHDAFAAERQAWSLERERLYFRIANLEKLLRTGNGYSPAKSPVLSPHILSNITSPQSRSTTNSNRLPSIAEDEDLPPLSQRRENAPQSIDMPSIRNQFDHLESTVSFQGDSPNAVRVEDIPSSPTHDTATSPLPLTNRMEAGHTPLHAPRPLTPPPQNSISMDGIEDTPTRTNTALNNFLTKSNDEDEEKELKGPLNMPELPNSPDASNFTFEALSKRLEQIERNPDEGRPVIFNQPSPGMVSPANEPVDSVAAEKPTEEIPLAPTASRMPEPSTSDLSSNAISSAALSPLTKHTSREQSEEKAQADFESGGIKLRKKPSTNFGAPFGQLNFGAGRKTSQDWQ